MQIKGKSREPADKPASVEISTEGGQPVLRLNGDWTLKTAPEAARRLDQTVAQVGANAKIDASGLGRVDIAGAYLLDRALPAADLSGESAGTKRLLEVVRGAVRAPAPPRPALSPVRVFLERIGRGLAALGDGAVATVSFLGETLAALVRFVSHPRQIRWVAIANVMEEAGFNAMPVISLLSFFIGVVIAYLGARTLSDFGVSVFTVELVGFSVLREFAIVITAVVLAGRTDSAFTAEIGAMKMRQEIDAMRVMGFDPIETLVVPRVIAMLAMTPILTFVAMLAGLFGGWLACWAYLHVSPMMFLQRLHDGVPVQHFWVGMSKAPAFALVLAVVGCRHGLAVGGDVGSLGRRVTSSVVEAISIIIALDAIFAVWFLQVDL